MENFISYYVKYEDKSSGDIQEFTFDPTFEQSPLEQCLQILHNIDCEIISCEPYEGQI